MLILQRKKIHNTLDEGDIGVGEITPVQPPSEPSLFPGDPGPNPNNNRWDFTTDDIPDIMKLFPSDAALKNRKKKRTEYYFEASKPFLFEAVSGETSNFKELFDNVITDDKFKSLKRETRTFYNKNAKSENIIITFNNFPNLEIVLSSDKLQEGQNKSKFRLIVNLMPFSLFKYNPIDTAIIQTKTSDIKSTIYEALDKVNDIFKSIKVISAYLSKAKQIGDYLNKYLQTSKSF
jgi:hypothetical protein